MSNNTITAPKGFFSAGIYCGIKASGKPDLALLTCPTGAKAAAVFTTNKITSAAVEISRGHVKSSAIRAVIVNSGNANACTGRKGLNNALGMCRQSARLIGAELHQVLVASTGIIGKHLPMQRINSGIKTAFEKLSSSAAAGLEFTRAIMTTDTVPKQAVRRIQISGKNITIAGTTKGAGMIAPNMATTLCFITTDIAISKPLLARALKTAIDVSLNKLTVDGHQSTNDTAIILASGLAENRPITSSCPGYKKFAKTLMNLCDDLARQMAIDAEGATRIFKVVVKNAATKTDAAKAARAVAEYPLVKCAINGADPNWGRIICAVGSAGVRFNPNKLSCKLGNITVFKNGAPANFDQKEASRVVAQKEHTITINLAVGAYNDFCYGCDLSREYVTINADYHT